MPPDFGLPPKMSRWSTLPWLKALAGLKLQLLTGKDLNSVWEKAQVFASRLMDALYMGLRRMPARGEHCIWMPDQLAGFMERRLNRGLTCAWAMCPRASPCLPAAW